MYVVTGLAVNKKWCALVLAYILKQYQRNLFRFEQEATNLLHKRNHIKKNQTKVLWSYNHNWN